MALTEGHDEPADGLTVLDELEDGPVGGSHPPHHRPPRRPRPLVKDAPFGVEAGEAVQVEWGLGLADVGNHDLVVRIAAPDHNPAGVHEGVDAFSGGTPGSCSGGSFARRPRP
jgi:hypothetical protein